MFVFLKLNHISFLYLTGTFIHISVGKTPTVILFCVCVCVCARARARARRRRRVEQILKHVVLQFYRFHFFIFQAIYFVFIIDNFTLMLYNIVCLNLLSVHFYMLYFTYIYIYIYIYIYMLFKTEHDCEIYQLTCTLYI